MKYAIKQIVIAGILSVLALGSAAAGTHNYKHSDGRKVRIGCTGGGCIVIYYSKTGAKTKKLKSPGGSSNFYKWEKKVLASGYKRS